MKRGFRWTRFLGALACPLALISAAHAQNPPPAKAPLAFEVATVKPSDTSKMIIIDMRVYPGARLIIHGHNLRMLIADAFDIPAWQLVGGEKRLDSPLYDIEGKPPEELRDAIPGGEYSNLGIQDARVRAMLQTLLIERFQLKFHKESQPGTVYVLERGDGPLRLKSAELNLYTRSEDGSIAPSHAYPTGDVGMASGRPVGIHQTSMAQLASVLSGLERVTVSDQTGLPGFYNFKSQTVLTNDDFKNGGPMHLLVEAVPEMGLKLVKTQGVVDKFVIDHAEAPTPD